MDTIHHNEKIKYYSRSLEIFKRLNSLILIQEFN